MMRRGLALAVLSVGVTLAVGAGSGPFDTPRSAVAAPVAPRPFNADKPLTVVADEVTVDNPGRRLVARGHVVLTYGVDRATADLLRFDRAARTAELSGHVRVADPDGRASGGTVLLFLTEDLGEITRTVMTGGAVLEGKEYSLSADRIDADRASGGLVAEGHVNAFSAPDLIITGARATYDHRRQYGVVTGGAVVSNRAGRLLGNWLEVFRAEHRAVVHGPAQAEVYGATITGAGATVDFRRSTAVFTGHAVVTRRQGTLWADRVTVYYEARRISAEGTTRARFTDLGEDASP